MRNTYLSILMIILSTLMVACKGGGDAASSSGGGGASAARAVAITATEYTFEISGNGVTFSADFHGYAERNYGGAQINPQYTLVALGAAVQTYTLTSESFIANITLNTGAGVLTIVTKRNGTAIRTDTINTNATGISINDAN
jgi:hypothetical protein